jgi:hypothetical protein
MLQFNINLTTLAVVLWSGMLIIAGSIWILASQVRKVADLLDQHSTRPADQPRRRAATRALVRSSAPRSLPNAQARLDELYGVRAN